VTAVGVGKPAFVNLPGWYTVHNLGYIADGIIALKGVWYNYQTE
jgi:hypothetical protein